MGQHRIFFSLAGKARPKHWVTTQAEEQREEEQHLPPWQTQSRSFPDNSLRAQGLQAVANAAYQDQAGHSQGKVQNSPAEVFNRLVSESLQSAGPVEQDTLLHRRLRLAVISSSSQSPAPPRRPVIAPSPTPLPSRALVCVWEGQGGQTAASTT